MFAAFNPFDSDELEQFNNYEEPEPFDEEGNPIQQLQIINEEESYSSDDTPNVASDPNEETIHMSDLENIRVVLSLLTKYPGGILSSHLKNHQGLIILPLQAISMIRKPTGNHQCNPPAIIYYPKDGPESAPHMPQFNEAMRLLYSVPQ